MSLFPLNILLTRLISHGTLTVVGTEGKSYTFEGRTRGPSVTIRFVDPKAKWRIVRNPGLAFGELYTEGGFTLENCTLRELLEVVLVSATRSHPGGLMGKLVDTATEAFGGRNTLGRSTRNVQHHYDIDHHLYELFLDRDMQYSCAYWRPGVTSLEQAQLDKKRHIANKLLLEPGMKVLDIGSGWGGMALHLAREHGVEVTGVTLSADQYETSVRRAEEEGLSDRVKFKLLDYRMEAGAFDRIVSVGMFEHVGRAHFAEYFRHIDRLLKPKGVALIHTIGKMAPPAGINAWIRRYIFPGAYLPSISQLGSVIERQRLWLTDAEVLRTHYAETLKAWDDRVQAHRAEITAMHDERFMRMWEFYLQTCETSFRHGQFCVFQLQIAKEIGVVPTTRDYLYADVNAVPRATLRVIASPGDVRTGIVSGNSDGSVEEIP